MLSRWKKERLRKFLKQPVQFASILDPVMPVVPLLRGRLQGVEEIMGLAFEQVWEDLEAAALSVSDQKKLAVEQFEKLEDMLFDQISLVEVHVDEEELFVTSAEIAARAE